MSHNTSCTVPCRQIRAQYDETTITVYQAYSPTIADAAVAAQRLNASPEFKPGRMTWIKPSWAWMMYRAGYSYKDARQARILALRMRHDHFLGLLRRGVLSHGPGIDNTRDKTGEVRIQWDPERTPALGKLADRSIQIGIPGSLSDQWAKEWIVSIEDVTDRARSLKKALDEDANISLEALVESGLVPEERLFTVPDDIMNKLDMTQAV